MATSGRREKDQNMAADMKARGEERRTGRCAICYNLIPNGLFNPSGWDNHLLKCPGPRRKGNRTFGSSTGNRRAAARY